MFNNIGPRCEDDMFLMFDREILEHSRVLQFATSMVAESLVRYTFSVTGR
jgi:hypothetical protein